MILSENLLVRLASELQQSSSQKAMKRYLQTFRDGNKKLSYLNEPLLDAEQGNMQTLDAMAKIVNEDRILPDLRIFVLREIVGDVRGHDAAGEIQRIFEFAQKKIVYRRDPFGVERVADIWSTLYALNPKEPEGDCGIKSTFIATCCAILGHKPFFVMVKQRADQKAFNHVYNAVMVNNKIQFLDATPANEPMGFEVKAAKKYLYKIF